MFLNLNHIKKSFGQGDSRVEVLKGIDLSIEKGEFLRSFRSFRFPESPPCLILSVESIMLTADRSRSTENSWRK